MIAISIGVLLIAFAVVAVLPNFWLNWLDQVIAVLKGGIPLFALFVGLIALFIGIADIKDRIEAKREEAEERKSAAQEKSE